MADSKISITEGSGKDVDTRTNDAGDHRQVVVFGHPTATDSVAEVLGKDPTSNTEGVVVRDVNTSAIVSALGGSITVQLDPGHTLGKIQSISETVAVYFDPSAPAVSASFSGTMAVYFDQSAPAVTAYAGETLAVSLDPGHEIGSVKGINSSIAVYFDRGNPTVTANAGTGSLTVQFDPGHTLGKIDTVASLGGTVAVVQVSAAGDSLFSTKTYSSASGSVSGSYPSGKTVVAPDAGDKIKVFAISVTTTAQDHIVVQFTNGADSSPTEYWRYGLQAPAAGVAGANLAVTPPGYLFATAAGSTLAIDRDVDSLVHYSVSYFVESV